MFEPFEVYFIKKSKKNSKTKARKKELKIKWNKLSNKKKLKFIKKAERKYDDYVEKNPNESLKSFGNYLEKKELELLMKSYGYPDKMAPNSKVYFLRKLKSDHENSELDSYDESKSESDKKWLELNTNQRSQLLLEYYQHVSDYNNQYFTFARSLPEQRISDFNLLTCPSLRGTKIKEEPDEDESPKNSFKNIAKELTPYYIYYEKHKDEFSDVKPFLAVTKARTAFTNLSDKKKLKYIKEAESKFDSFDFSFHAEKPIFSQFLNKHEVKILLESYGMPEMIPNLSAYFMRLNYKEYLNDTPNDRMSKVFAKYKSLNETEKSEFIEKHLKATEESKLAKKRFLASLPPQRLPDYNQFTTKTPSKPKTSKKEMIEIKTEPIVDQIEDSILEFKLEPTAMDGLSNTEDEEDAIESFISKNLNIPQNAFTIFLLEELKWNVTSNMNETKSKLYLNETAIKWLNLDINSKEKFENQYISNKNELNSSIKEFIKSSKKSDLDLKVIRKEINKRIKNKSRKIEFIFDENEQETVFLDESNPIISLIHTSIEKIVVDKNLKNVNSDKDSEINSIKSIKRKLHQELNNSNKVVKKV